jgi:hypothetical protein
MSLLTVLVLLVLLYLVPEILRPKNQRYEYPEIPDLPTTTSQQEYEGEGISAERRISRMEGISAEREGTIGAPKIALPAEVSIPQYTEPGNAWTGKVQLANVVNGVIFAEILQPPRAKRPIQPMWKK